MDFANMTEQEIQRIKKIDAVIENMGGHDKAHGIVDPANIQLSLDYQAYLKSLEEHKEYFTVTDIMTALFEGKFGNGSSFDPENPGEFEAEVWALIEGIYLYFGEENRGKTFYDLDNPLEATLFQIYHDTVKEYECLYSKHGRMQLGEGIKAFDETRYKELPENFHSIATIGNLILDRVKWVPEQLWSAMLSKKQANEVINHLKK